MVAPLVGLAAQYLIGKGAEKAGISNDAVKAFTNPKGFLIGKAAEVIADKTGLPKDVVDFAVNPKAAAKSFAVNKAKEAIMGDAKGGSPQYVSENEPDWTSGSSAYKKGGKVRSIDGCAKRGKTKGRYL